MALSLPDPHASPHASPHTFSGVVNISATVNIATTCIVLNAKGLKLLTAHAGGTEASMITQHPETEMAILSFPQPFGASGSENISISITYNGIINHESANGLFLSKNVVPDPVPRDIKRAMALWREHSYQRREMRHKRRRRQYESVMHAPQHADADTEMMFATQFEETDARSMFPAFDEPSLKATFEATITVPDDTDNADKAPLQVLFNTRNSSAAECNAVKGSCVHTFERTLNPLPTYLVALAVGHFDFLEKTGSGGVVYRIVTPPGYSAWAQHALDCSVHAAEFFSASYKFPYGSMNHKMDSISVTAIDMDAMVGSH
jgi:aminopeptidase N